MVFTARWWIGLALSSLFCYIIFGNISTKAGYPRWHSLAMLVPIANVVAILFFAFSEWPIESKLLELQLRDASR